MRNILSLLSIVFILGCQTEKGVNVATLQEVYQNGYDEGKADGKIEAAAEFKKSLMTPEDWKQWTIITKLSGQPLAELRRKLDTAKRGTAKHEFTVEQLEAAIKMKQQAK